MKKIILLSLSLFLTSCSDTTTVDLTRCLSVPSDLVAWIEEWLTIDGWGEFTNVQAVKSTDFENVYFISWYLQWAWIEQNTYTATFASNSLELWWWLVGSVDGSAKEFSVFNSFKQVTRLDDWSKESIACVKNVL